MSLYFTMQEIDDQESIKTSLKGMFELMRIMHEKILKIEVEQERQKFDRILSESINSLSSFSNQGPSWLKEQYTRAQNDKAVMVDRATSPLRELPSTQDIPRRSPSSLGNHHLFSDATSTTYTLGTKINSSYSMHIGNTSTVNTLTELPNNISKGKQTFSLAESSNSTQQTHLTENDLRTINPAVITAATSTKSLSPEVNNVDDTEDTASTATSLDPRLSEKQADSPDIDSFADHTADLPEIFADPPPRTDAFDWYLQSSHAINTATSIQPAGIIRRSFPSRTPIPRVIPADTSSRSSSPEQTLVEMNSYNQLPTTTTYETNNPSPAQASPNASTVPPSPLIFSSEPTDKQAKMEPSSGSSQSEKSTTGESEADETAEYLAVSSPSTSSTSSATPPPKGKYKRKPRYVDPSILSAPKVLRSGKAGMEVSSFF